MHEWMWRWWWLAWLAVFALPAWWSFDREPPLRVLMSPHSIGAESTEPGSVAVFVMPVWRDPVRECSVDVTRYLIDSAGTKYELSRQTLSPAGIDTIEAKMGPFLRVAVQVPPSAAAGDAIVGSEWRWQCNPMHFLWPIRLSAAWPLSIKEQP